MKIKYKFSHRAGDLYYWTSVNRVSANDSRYETIVCSVNWFWSK